MKLSEKIAASVSAAALGIAAWAIPAAAASDDPTPYTVDAAGITLPAGAAFVDNQEINVQSTVGSFSIHFESKCVDRDDAECAGDLHDWAQYLGKSFIPWSAFGLTGDFCITWVQIGGYDEHFGEGGQQSVCTTGNGECPSDFIKLGESYDGGNSWVADSDYASVILVAGKPGEYRNFVLYDVLSGALLKRDDLKDISHICVKPTSGSTPSSEPSSTPSETPSTTPSSTPSTTPSSTPSETPSTTPSTTPSETPSTTPSTTPSPTSSASPSTSSSPSPSPSYIEPSTQVNSPTPQATGSVAPTGSASPTPSTTPSSPDEEPSTSPSTETKVLSAGPAVAVVGTPTYTG